MGGFLVFDKFAFITLLCAVFCFGWSIQAKINIRVPKETIQELRDQAKACEQETGVPADQLKKIVAGEHIENEASKKFMHCVCYNYGITDKDGHVIVMGKLANLPVISGTQDEYVNNLKECNKISESNYLETIYAVSKCVHNMAEFIV